MPPEYNWMGEAKEPSMGKRGSRGTSTNTHSRAAQPGHTGTMLSAPYSAYRISAHPLVLHGAVVV